MVDKPTTCGFCSCGCALYVEPANSRVAALCSSTNHPVSTGRLCFKGWNAIPGLMGADRLRTPLIRKGESLERVSWDEAISYTASNLKRIISASGAASIGVIGSGKLTNEECYSLVKFARQIIGTPHIDGTSRFYDASMVPALLETIGLAASQVDLNFVARAGSMLVVGANVMEQLAHVGSRIQDAVEAGCKVVAADPRISRIAPQASLFLHPIPGTDLVWLRALLKTIIDNKLYVEAASEIAGFRDLCESLKDVSIQQLAGDCGVDAGEIQQAAEILSQNPPLVVMFGLGVLQQAGASELVKALADVAMLLGGSVMPLRGQNNAQGACDMGLATEYLPGCMPISDNQARQKWESVWNCKLAETPGMNAAEMLRACVSGDIKALLVFGDNLALSAPNSDSAIGALEKLEFLAVSDLYLTDTAQVANVVFPACSFLEKEGTFTNIERRVQRVRKLFEPLGESKSDLEIASLLARSLGAELPDDTEAVMEEISVNVPQYSGVSYSELESGWGKPWPVNGVKAAMRPIAAIAQSEDPDYPLRLIASRIHYHQQTGTICARTSILAREYPESFAEMNEREAERYGLKAGRPVIISSRFGSLTRMLILSDAVPEGCVHVPHFFGGDSPNALASQECDPISRAPVYKAIAVKVEAAK